MVKSAMGDDYVIFRNEFRPVHLAYLEQKIVDVQIHSARKNLFSDKEIVSNIIIGVITLKLVAFRILKKLPLPE